MPDTPLFDPPLVGRLPLPIHRELVAMQQEFVVNGEANTADELAKAIEASIAYVGRLWVAEYLAATTRDPTVATPGLNAEVFERLGAGKPMLTGAWLALSRRLRARFVESRTATVVERLVAWNPGAEDDRDVPLARLLAFRNAFAHGSFLAPVESIRAHRLLLHDVLSAVPGLVSQPPVFREPETGVWFECSGEGRTVSAPGGLAGDGHPVVVTHDDHLPLFPMLVATRTPGPDLAPPSELQTKTSLASHPALGVWLDRYAHERDGHLEAPPASFRRPLPAGLVAALGDALADDGLTLVDAPPGAGADALLDAAYDGEEMPLSRFASVSRLRIARGEVSQSGVSVARAVLRLVERALGERAGGRPLDAAHALAEDGPVAKALADLHHAGKRALLVLADLQEGTTPYRGEPFTVLDLWRALAGKPLTVVATAWPGALGRAVFDHRLAWPVPTSPDAEDVTRAVSQIARTPLHRRVLEAVVGSAEPVSLFALCDGLDIGGGEPVFEPAVERALWDLEPVLRWYRAAADESGERVRLWSPFHPVLAGAVRAGADR